MSGFDLKQLNRNDQVVMGAGILAFIASFLPYYGWHVDGFGGWSTSAWTGYAIVGLLLVFLAAAIVAARIFANATLPSLPVGPNLLVTALAAIGTLLVIIRGFTYPHASGVGGSVGVRWGGYILMIVCIVETVAAAMNFRASGEKLQWDASALNRPAAPAAQAPYAPGPRSGAQEPYATPAQPSAPDQGTPGV